MRRCVLECVFACNLSYLLQLTVDMLHNQINGHHVATTWWRNKQTKTKWDDVNVK